MFKMFLKKYKWDVIIFFGLFIVSLIFIFLFTEKSQLGELSTDSSGYTLISEALADFHWPRWTRTPTYPIFLTLIRWITHDLSYVNYVQMVLNAFNAPLIYILLRMMGLSKKRAIIGGIITIPNYHIISYTHTIMTEGIIVPVLLTYLITTITFVKNHKSWKNTLLFLAFGLALMFLKPGFYLLALAFVIALVIYLLYIKKKIYWKTILVSFFTIVIAVLGWQTLNKLQFGYFSMGYVSHINELGKYMQYGYLDDYEVTEETSPELAEFVNQRKFFKGYSPYTLRNKVRATGMHIETLEIIEINKEIKEGRILDFIQQSLELYPNTLSLHRYYRFGYPETEWKDNVIDTIETKFYDNWKSFYLLGILSIAFYIFFSIGKNKIKKDSFLTTIILFLAIFYSTAVVAAFGYDDYQRLNIPAEPLMIVSVYLAILWLIDIVIHIYKTIFKKNGN